MPDLSAMDGVSPIYVQSSGNNISVIIDIRAFDNSIQSAVRYVNDHIYDYNMFLDSLFIDLEDIMKIRLERKPLTIYAGIMYNQKGNIFISTSSEIEYYNHEGNLHGIYVLRINLESDKYIRSIMNHFNLRVSSELWFSLSTSKDARMLYDSLH